MLAAIVAIAGTLALCGAARDTGAAPRAHARQAKSNTCKAARDTTQQAGPLFVPIATTAPSTQLFGQPVASYPRKPVHLDAAAAAGPVGTNKWYNQLLLAPAGTDSIFPLPYAIAYLNGSSILSQGPKPLVGIGITHTTVQQRVSTPNPAANPIQTYSNPLLVTMAMGAAEITPAKLSASLSDFSELAAAFTLAPGQASPANAPARMRMQLARGAAFVTIQYTALTPTIGSALAITSFTTVGNVHGFTKARIAFNDNSEWLIYHAPEPPNAAPLQLTLNAGSVTASKPWTGVMQIARMSASKAGGAEETVYDNAVGVWVVGATVSSGAEGSGQYGFNWAVDGPRACDNVAPLIFALPHHVASFASSTKAVQPTVVLPSRTSGDMTLYQSRTWNFQENVKVASKFSVDPINPTFAAQAPTADDLAVLRSIATQELTTDFTKESNVGSYYFGGKKLAKQALQCLTLSKILKDTVLTQQCVAKAKASYLQYVNMKTSASPLAYETTWKGIISTAFLKTGDENADFGNGVYNDHHFHYGYFVHAAAVLTHLDPSFQKDVQLFVNTLIRDVNNPSTKDQFFPFSRYFDWYAGHSWAAGLQSVADGKNEESTSEEVNFFYGLKTWAEVTKQTKLAALANLQLSILHRTLNMYFLMKTDNKVQPANFIQNRVTGILFENKVAHTTFFSPNEEAIHMVHVLPITPITAFTRDVKYVEEEYTDSGPGKGNNQIQKLANQHDTNFKTILLVQFAVAQPRQILDQMKSSLKTIVLDDGLSYTWSLGFAISQLGKK